MKFFKYSLIAAIALSGALTACSDDDDYVPGPLSPGAYFPGATTKTVVLSLTEPTQTVTIDINRYGETAAADYAVVSTTESTGVFTVPATVHFDADQTAAAINITIDAEAVEYGQKASVDLAFGEGTAVSAYGNKSLTLTVSKPEPYKSLGMGQYCETCFSEMFDWSSFGITEDVMLEVEIEESLLKPGYYRIVNLYGPNSKYFSFIWENDKGEIVGGPYEDSYFYIDASNPDKVFIPAQSTGMDFNEEYGNIMIMSDCEENLNSGFSNLYGKMKDGVIAFADKNSILTYLPLYQGGKLFNTNANGNAVLVLPGATYGDYNAEISYSGLFNNASTGTYEAVCSVSLGSDVESAKVAMVKAANDDEAVKAVTDGTVESVEIRNSGDDQQLFLPVDGDGTYYATVVTYAKGSVQKSATTRVKITVASTEEGNWEDFGSAMIIDGWATGRFTFQNGYTYEDVIWEIPVQRNTENHNMLRLVDMYTSDPEYNFLVYSGTNINTAGSYVVIDITNPAAVGIAPQWGGMTWAKDDVPFAGGDDLIIGNQVGYAMSLDYTNDEAIDLVDGNVDALEDGILTITQPMFEGPEGFGYSWTSKPYSALQFSALTPAGAPAKVGAKTRLSVRRIIANGSRKAVRASSEGNRYRISLRATTTNATLK